VREVVPQLQAVYPALPVNFRHFDLWREQARSFTGMAAFVAGALTLTGTTAPSTATPSAAAPPAPAATPSSPEVIDCAETATALAVERLRPLTELVSEAVAQRRFQLLLAAGFALAALLLAALAIYGVVSYGVAQRRREIGVRMALGARLSALLGLVLGSGLRPVLLGLAAGLAGAAACGRLVQSLLFGTRATDPWALAAVALTLTAVATAACLLPALDAARTDPAGVLREG
jgi:predicted lysophospholipase L1 biosynthesis ABC-type transport system permease subunit